jgi:hypothetical protein
MEIEDIALSTAMKELIPTRRSVDEVCVAFDVKRDAVTKMSNAWEDNAGALILANLGMPRMTPHSKHYAVKYHWFRDHVGVDVEVKKIDTKLRKADIFTKGLTYQTFVTLRKLVCGW